MAGYISIIFLVLSAAAEFVLIKKATAVVDPVLAGLVIFSIACLLLSATAIVRKAPPVELSNMPILLMIGSVGCVANFFWISGAKFTTVTNAAVLSRADVLFTMLLTLALIHEKIRKIAWVSLPVMLGGIFLVTQVDLTKFSLGYLGDYLILAYAFMLSVNAFIIKRSMKATKGISVAMFNTAINTCLFGTIFCVLRFGGNAAVPISDIPVMTWIYLAGCGIGSYVFFISYYASLKLLPIWEVRLLCLTTPVAAALFGWFLNEPLPTLTQISGGFLIVAGAAGIILSGAKRSAKHKTELKEIILKA